MRPDGSYLLQSEAQSGLLWSILVFGISKLAHIQLFRRRATALQLATGGSAITAIEVLKEAGVAEENILFLNVVSCPEGLRALAEKTPGTPMPCLLKCPAKRLHNKR